MRATDPLGRTALGIVNVILDCRSDPPVFPGGSVTVIVNVTDPVRSRIHNVTAVDPDSPPVRLCLPFVVKLLLWLSLFCTPLQTCI